MKNIVVPFFFANMASATIVENKNLHTKINGLMERASKQKKKKKKFRHHFVKSNIFILTENQINSSSSLIKLSIQIISGILFVRGTAFAVKSQC